MSPDNREALRRRVIQAAYTALQKKGFVCAVDVFQGIDALDEDAIENWRKGRLPYLERAIRMNLKKISLAMQFIRNWAEETGLRPSQTAYLLKSGSDRLHLIFSKSANPVIEKAYRTHYVSPDLREKKNSRIQTRRLEAETVVYAIIRVSQCSKCKKELLPGDFLAKRGQDALCMDCAGLGCLVYLRRGVAKLSRLAREYSGPYAVVVQFSRTRGRYERQGLLVEEEALEKAQQSCDRGIKV